MLRLSPPALSSKTTTQLSTLQALVDSEGTYPEQVRRAKAEWDRKTSNKAKRAATEEIRAQLSAMSYGQRCHYCEDSCADEIEHIRPKDLYPDWAFRWDNYVYSCGGCNGPKSNKFAVLDAFDALIHVQRSSSSPVTPPLAGRQALLDPRTEDPLEFLFLDLTYNTFHFTPRPSLNEADRKRAQYTIELLHLNDRPHLVALRRSAFSQYAVALRDYVKATIDGYPPNTLTVQVLRQGIHRTVWEEMKRQRGALKLPGSGYTLDLLFNFSPELLAL